MQLGRYRQTADLPRIIPVFPLAGVSLFPRSTLPLNIFEPRYLRMVDDALSGSRVIGMVQPQAGEPEPWHPALRATGCLGRISAYAETEDGRYLITLTGVCRFRPVREEQIQTPYRQVLADYAPFAADLIPGLDGGTEADAGRLLSALRRYVQANELKADWEAIDPLPAEALANTLCSLLPLGPDERQELLEAPTLGQRIEHLAHFLELGTTPQEPGDERLQ